MILQIKHVLPGLHDSERGSMATFNVDGESQHPRLQPTPGCLRKALSNRATGSYPAFSVKLKTGGEIRVVTVPCRTVWLCQWRKGFPVPGEVPARTGRVRGRGSSTPTRPAQSARTEWQRGAVSSSPRHPESGLCRGVRALASPPGQLGAHEPKAHRHRGQPTRPPGGPPGPARSRRPRPLRVRAPPATGTGRSQSRSESVTQGTRVRSVVAGLPSPAVPVPLCCQ